MGKELKAHIIQRQYTNGSEDVQMANKHIKRHSAPLSISKTQIKATRDNNSHPAGRLLSKQKITNVRKNVEK